MLPSAVCTEDGLNTWIDYFGGRMFVVGHTEGKEERRTATSNGPASALRSPTTAAEDRSLAKTVPNPF